MIYHLDSIIIITMIVIINTFIFAAEGGQLPSQREQQQLEREQDARGSQWPRHVPIYDQCGQ